MREVKAVGVIVLACLYMADASSLPFGDFHGSGSMPDDIYVVRACKINRF